MPCWGHAIRFDGMGGQLVKPLPLTAMFWIRAPASVLDYVSIIFYKGCFFLLCQKGFSPGSLVSPLAKFNCVKRDMCEIVNVGVVRVRESLHNK